MDAVLGCAERMGRAKSRCMFSDIHFRLGHVVLLENGVACCSSVSLGMGLGILGHKVVALVQHKRARVDLERGGDGHG